jgi:capsid protein
MAMKPIATSPGYRVNDRRGANHHWDGAFNGRSNSLYKGATQSTDRTSIDALNRDTHRNVTQAGRRVLLSVGRWLFSNFPVVQGAIVEQAVLATENFQPQFYGADKAWGTLAEDWLIEWGRICDVAGPPFDFQVFRELLLISMIRDGDELVLLTETEEGYPLIQVIPGHRVDNWTANDYVIGGAFDGARIVDGVILDRTRRAIGYRIYNEMATAYEDIPASNAILTWRPHWADQCRGFSMLSSAIYDFQDIRESRAFELIAQKAASAFALIETNESGMADPAKSVIRTAATKDDYGGNTASAVETLEGGIYKRFKAGTNSKLEAFSYDRPGANVMLYQDALIRDAFRGIEWDYHFSVDPTKPGGAAMRIIVEKINRTLLRRKAMVEGVCRRIHGYAISKAIKLGLLPMNDEWWKWEYQLGPQLTADKMYDSKVDLLDYNARFTTLRHNCAKRGAYWEDVQDQWLDEQKRFQDQAKAKGVDLTKIAIPEATAEAISTESSVETDNNPGGGNQGGQKKRNDQ